MKVLGRNIDKDWKGHLVLLPEEGEDLWHVFNCIKEGDRVRASTVRKVQVESATGSSSSSRMRTTVTVEVESTDFDIDSGQVRVKGRNVVENQFIKMGAYHTVDLEANHKFTLHKDHWDKITSDRIYEACDPMKHADLAAITMQEGLAYVLLITSSMTITRAKIDVTIPRKGKGDDTQRKKAITKFYDLLLTAILRHFNFDVIKAVILASPGFYKDQFFDYIFKIAAQTDNKVLLENKNKFILAHSSNGFKSSLREILENPTVASRLTDTKAAGESRALEQFMAMLGTDPDRAYYGYKHVKKAQAGQAIDTLLISDTLFRAKDVVERRKYISLVNRVRQNGGDVKIFSSLHVTGEQLDEMTGLAAILRFPMPEIDEESHGLDSDDEKS